MKKEFLVKLNIFLFHLKYHFISFSPISKLIILDKKYWKFFLKYNNPSLTFTLDYIQRAKKKYNKIK